MKNDSCNSKDRRRKSPLALIGSTYGRWEVIGSAEPRGYYSYFLCRCQCGVEREVFSANLVTGKSRGCASCGSIKDGHSLTGSGASWEAMMARCYRTGHPHYSKYGGSGIVVCDRWHKYENFLSDMGNRPEGKTLDRIDNHKGYEPTNCRWATYEEQGNNRKNNRKVVFDGKEFTVSMLAKHLGVKVSTLFQRIYHGRNLATGKSDSLSPKLVEWNGGKYTLSELSEKLGIKYETLVSRIRYGIALDSPLHRGRRA